MSDIVDELRDLFLPSNDPDQRQEDRLALDAADEIERLHARNAKLERVVEAAYLTGYDDGWNVAASDDDAFEPDVGLATYRREDGTLHFTTDEPCKTCGGWSEGDVVGPPCPDCGGDAEPPLWVWECGSCGGTHWAEFTPGQKTCRDCGADDE